MSSHPHTPRFEPAREGGSADEDASCDAERVDREPLNSRHAPQRLACSGWAAMRCDTLREFAACSRTSLVDTPLCTPDGNTNGNARQRGETAKVQQHHHHYVTIRRSCRHAKKEALSGTPYGIRGVAMIPGLARNRASLAAVHRRCSSGPSRPRLGPTPRRRLFHTEACLPLQY